MRKKQAWYLWRWPSFKRNSRSHQNTLFIFIIHLHIYSFISTSATLFCLPSYARLLSPNCSVLSALEDKFAFEIAVGVNGAFWVKAADPASTVAATNAILNSELLAPHEVHRMVKIVVDNIRRSSWYGCQICRRKTTVPSHRNTCKPRVNK